VKEEDLFNYLLKTVYPDLVKSRRQFSKWDCYSPSTTHRIELKCRGTHYNTLIIEKIKYDALILKARDNFDIPIYINSTPKGIYRFNLFNINPVWETRYLKKTTTFSNNNKVPKEIALLPVIEAEIL